MPSIFLGMPHYPGAVDPEALMAAVAASSDEMDVGFSCLPSTGTAKGFNALWASALTQAEAGQITHFAMLHADCSPSIGWLQTLLAECERLSADLVAAIVPIKDGRGLTSTAIDTGGPWHVRRLTMAEIMSLPETFDRDDTIQAGFNPCGHALLVNTGCWIADLRKPLWFETDEAGEAHFFFTLNDRIRKQADGQWKPDTESEDWFFSRRLAAAGARYFATRRVRLVHTGRWRYGNQTGWGAWKTDEACHETEGCPAVA